MQAQAPGLQPAVDGHADDHRYHRAQAGCQAHRQQGVRIPDRGEIRQRYPRCDNGDDIMQERKFRAAASAEVPAERKMQAGKNAIEDIALQVSRTSGDDRRIQREPADDRRGRELCDRRYCHTKDRTDDEGIPEGLPRPRALPRPNILCAQSRYRRQHRRGHEEHEADELLDDADCRRIGEPAHIGDDRDDEERNLDKAILQGYGHADAQDAAKDLPFRPPGGPVNFHGPGAAHIDKGHHHADGLGKRRAQGRAHRSQMQRPHEQIVEHDIGTAGYGHEIQRAARIPKPAENRANDIVGRDQRYAQEAHPQVCFRIGYGRRRRLHPRRDLTGQQQAACRQQHRHAQEQDGRIADDCRTARPVARTDSLRNADRRAHRQPHDHDREHMHDLAADGHGRDAGRSLELTDDEQIRHAIERLQEV